MHEKTTTHHPQKTRSPRPPPPAHAATATKVPEGGFSRNTPPAKSSQAFVTKAHQVRRVHAHRPVVGKFGSSSILYGNSSILYGRKKRCRAFKLDQLQKVTL